MSIRHLHPETDPSQQTKKRVALVHVLQPEFHNLDPAEFTEIDDHIAELITPPKLRESLLDTGAPTAPRLRNSEGRGVSVVSYESPEPGLRWIRLSVTPIEFGLFSRHVDMLASTAINATKASRDLKLQKETGNMAAKARTDEDNAAAKRAAVRQVQRKLPNMESYLTDQIRPRIDTINRFIEMTRYRNLNRGVYDTVQDHFEHLRLFVFGDMLDAVGNHRGWTEQESVRAEHELKGRLYVRGSTPEKVQNFQAMLDLAADYYGHKQAFILTKIADSNRYLNKNRDAVADAERKDQERAGDAD